ncbi:hypothetical protein TNCV_1439041 [Trichonephila clavipes]|nr:hypothetical protein TNCV_1439041 [Trichonephila clavipes]
MSGPIAPRNRHTWERSDILTKAISGSRTSVENEHLRPPVQHNASPDGRPKTKTATISSARSSAFISEEFPSVSTVSRSLQYFS